MNELPRGVVRLLGSDGEFIGTGVMVAPEIVVSCAHVVAGEESLRIEASANATGGPRAMLDAMVELLSATSELQDGEHRGTGHDDLALLRVIDPPPSLQPLPLLKDLTPALLKTYSGNLGIHGFSGSRGVEGGAHGLWLRGAVLATPEGFVRSGQVDGGVPQGFSGAPLLLRDDEGWLAAGIFYLGGEAAGQSVFYGSDVIIGVLERLGYAPLVRRARLAHASPLTTTHAGASGSRAVWSARVLVALMALGLPLAWWALVARDGDRAERGVGAQSARPVVRDRLAPQPVATPLRSAGPDAEAPGLDDASLSTHDAAAAPRSSPREKRRRATYDPLADERRE